MASSAATVPPAAPERVGMSCERLARIRPFMQKYVDDGKLAGITTLIARRGEVTHFESVGMAHIEAGMPMRNDTIVRIYSMTKPITSVAVMMLYEQGCLRLTAPVAEYLPEFADLRVYDEADSAGVAPKRPMTVRDLLTHTSGLSYGWGEGPVDRAYQQAKVTDGTLQDMARKLGELPLMHHPSAAWEYSLSTDVLGYLVQVVSGRPFDEYLQTEILQPLAMVDTAFHVPAEKLGRFAANYGPDTGSGAIEVIDDPQTGGFTRPASRPSGGGGLVGTASDYLRFAQMMVNGGELDGVRLLGRKTVRHMTRDHLPPELSVRWGEARSPSEGFGLGFAVTRDAAQAGEVGSDGTFYWSGMASTWFWIDPVEEIVAVLLTQFVPNDTYPILPEFQALVYGAIAH